MTKISDIIEIWKPVPNYELTYEVSNLGRFRIINYRNTGKSKIMKTSNDKDGYQLIGFVKNGVQKLQRSHRIVCAAFLENTENKPLINHKNGIKNDNRVCNLEWCNQSENTIHALNTGLKVPIIGSNASWSKLTEKDVLNIRNEVANGAVQRRLSEKYNVTFQTISSIVRRKNWLHV
jgi:hypothetical protein